MKIIKIENRAAKESGKPYRRLTAEVEGKEISGSYWGNQELAVGQEVELEIEEKNGFNNFKDKKSPFKNNRDEKMKELQDIKQKNIKDAQYRKEISIAFFNSTNSAIALLSQAGPIKDRRAFITEWRDWFIQEHKVHRLKELGVISAESIEGAQIGTEQKLTNCKTKDDLARIWSTLTPSEKKTYEPLKNKLKTTLA